MEEKLVTILNEMAEYLSIAQMKKLQEVLLKNLAENEPQKAEISNVEYIEDNFGQITPHHCGCLAA